MTAASPRPAFEAGLGFALDPFQRRALDALDAGQSVQASMNTPQFFMIATDLSVIPLISSSDYRTLIDLT
jgi:hypothetical protein